MILSKLIEPSREEAHLKGSLQEHNIFFMMSLYLLTTSNLL